MRTTKPIQEKQKVSKSTGSKKEYKLEEKKQQYEQAQNQMKAAGQKEVSFVDPDSRLMR
jgi:hypothetical protein